MSSGSGPMCEEPMWGVALEIEARLGIPNGRPPRATGEEDDEGANEGSAALTDRGVELQEEVYGPFSGQVLLPRWLCMDASIPHAHGDVISSAFLSPCKISSHVLPG